MAKVLLLDGNSLTYRAFFALPTDMATASGQVTNAVYGFTSMLQYLINEHRPDALVVSFDRPEPSFRHAIVSDYKAGRAETPDVLRQQMGLVRTVCEVLDLPMVDAAGFEADDVIATLAVQGCERGDDVIIVTGDRDAYQLVRDAHAPGEGSIRVLYNKRGVSDYALYDEAGIVERTGVHPTRYAEYAALRGDPSDNLPGVPGVGEKTAAKLINDYGDLAGVLANTAKATPKLRANLEAAREQVLSNAKATPVVKDVPGIDIAVARYPQPDVAAARQLFGTLEFRALTDRMLDAIAAGAGGMGRADLLPALGSSGGAVPVEVEFEAAADPQEAAARIESVSAAAEVAVLASWAGAEGRSALLGVTIADATGHALWVDGAFVSSDVVRSALAHLLMATDGTRMHGYRVKELLRSLHDAGLELGAIDALAIDTVIAGYLLDPADNAYALEELALRWANLDVRGPDAPPAGQLDLGGPDTDHRLTAARRAVAVAMLAEPMRAALDARGLLALYETIERPLIAVLARMEAAGVRVDTAYLKQLNDELVAEVARAEEEVFTAAGRRFLVNSVPQLRQVLFDELGLKTDKKTKTGYSTDAQSLEKLRGTHPIVEPLLRYREVEKLRSTYGEGLLAEVAADGRIHATFNQTVARTGRLSSDQPNLHNIPVRSEEGRRFRQAFVPADGCRFLVADYNQIELRVIAHLSGDPGLVDAFTTGADIHNATASRVFKVESGDVTIAHRSKAKMVSYGLAYGMESFGLAQRLGVPVAEAQEILDAYFVAFPNVKSYMERSVVDARNRGYTETLFGRRRLIPDLQSPNYRIRQMAERQAMNAGIQGLAADIFKVALVNIDLALRERAARSRLILQVHDEVILEVPPEEEASIGELTVDVMRGAAALDVPLEVNVAWGASWAEAKG